MIPNFIQSYLESGLDECRIIPMNWCAQKYFTVTFSGWKHLKLTIDNAHFNYLLEIAKCTLSGIVSSYKDTHAFTEPELSWGSLDGLCMLKIGIMENELYDILLEKEKLKRLP